MRFNVAFEGWLQSGTGASRLKRSFSVVAAAIFMCAPVHAIGQDEDPRPGISLCREAYRWETVNEAASPTASDRQVAGRYEMFVQRIAEIVVRERLDESEQKRLREICSGYLAGVADGTGFALQLYRNIKNKR